MLEVNAFDLPNKSAAWLPFEAQLIELATRHRASTPEELKLMEQLANGIIGKVDEIPPEWDGSPVGWKVIETFGLPNRHLIEHGGCLYAPAEFLSFAFDDYLKYKNVVEFDDDNIFWLSKSRRSYLQYHILEQSFGLVPVPDQKKRDFIKLANSHDGETAKIWARRSEWENGVEKMISFGATLEVRGTLDKITGKYPVTKGVWCYSENINSTQATFCSEQHTWEDWLFRVQAKIASLRLSGYRSFGDRQAHYYEIKDDLMKCLYYQNGARLTLPHDTFTVLEDWMFRCYLSDKTPIPFTGMINADNDFQFSYVYGENCRIVPRGRGSLRAPGAMTKHNKEHAAELGEARGLTMTQEKFLHFPDGEWTANELKAFGFNRTNLKSYLDHKLIRKCGKRGNAFLYTKVIM